MIVIVDTSVFNRYSIRNAFEYIGADVVVDGAQPVVPGVCAFAAGMQSLNESGLLEVLTREVVENGKPTLGVCLGMQMMAERSQEDGDHAGLGWFAGVSRRLTPSEPGLKVPHIGFNVVRQDTRSPLFRGCPDECDYYFLHSFHLDCPETQIIATCDYGGRVVAAIQKDNLFAVQFHPEKSQSSGLQLLRNFVNMGNDG